MLKINNLTKYYGDKKGIEDVNLEIKEGEIFGFIGPNGAGKSTTIKCIMDLINKNSGTITVSGEEVSRDNYALRKEIGYLPSEINLYDDLTVEKMISYSASFYKKDCKKKVEFLVKELELDTKKRIDELSLGNLKKLGIILALMHSPKLLILDEATSGLDPLMQEAFYNILKKEKESGVTIFFSSHILREVKKVCDRVAIIRDGKIIKVEQVENLVNVDFSIVKIKAENIGDIISGLECKIIEKNGENIKFIYSGDINELIKKISKHDITKLFIEEPEIEDIFMHYYKSEEGIENV